MPNWNQILDEIKETGSVHDVIRRKYLAQLSDLTGRNIIIYYSGWLQKPGLRGTEINDADKNGFMTVINSLDRSKGLDLLLHTEGGEANATESLVDYLRAMFGTDIRAIVPQLAMSAGTMIACSSKEIVMGKQSSLGPIDPQLGGKPAHGVIEEFKQARHEIMTDPRTIPIWQPIIAKYTPAFIGECINAVNMSRELVEGWLVTGMFEGLRTAERRAKKVVAELGDHTLTKSHGRHLGIKKCKEIGLKVVPLEKDGKLQDAVLSVHHACIHTLGTTSAFKIIENQNGTAFIQQAQQVVLK